MYQPHCVPSEDSFLRRDLPAWISEQEQIFVAFWRSAVTAAVIRILLVPHKKTSSHVCRLPLMYCLVVDNSVPTELPFNENKTCSITWLSSIFLSVPKTVPDVKKSTDLRVEIHLSWLWNEIIGKMNCGWFLWCHDKTDCSEHFIRNDNLNRCTNFVAIVIFDSENSSILSFKSIFAFWKCYFCIIMRPQKCKNFDMPLWNAGLFNINCPSFSLDLWCNYCVLRQSGFYLLLQYWNKTCLISVPISSRICQEASADFWDGLFWNVLKLLRCSNLLLFVWSFCWASYL